MLASHTFSFIVSRNTRHGVTLSLPLLVCYHTWERVGIPAEMKRKALVGPMVMFSTLPSDVCRPGGGYDE